MADFFAGEIATKLIKMLVKISRKELLFKTSANQLIRYINEILPTIQKIKYSGVELTEHQQFDLDSFLDMLHSGVELSYKVLSSSRWNVYKNLQLAKKMEKLEKNVSRFLQGPMLAHMLADLLHTRFEMVERLDRVDASNRRLEQYFGAMKIGVGGGGSVEEAVRSCMEEDENLVEGNTGNMNLSVGLDLGKKKVKEIVMGREDLWVVGGSGKTTLSLGLSGPEDFAIPAAAWEAMKFRSSSDILLSLKIEEINLQQKDEEDELSEKCAERDRDSVRVNDEVAETVVVGSGGGCGDINGICPPMVKLPPGMRVRVVDNTCSTWDLSKELALVVEGEEGIFNREMEAKESEEVDRVSPKREVEDVVVDNVAMITEIVDGLSNFSTSNEDDSSSSATEPRSNNVSPNGRIKRVITPGCWQKGEFLGGGSFGSVYEGISDDGIFFAVKEVSLLDQGDQGKQSVYQLEQEIALLSRFEHDNIVQYYGTEMDESKLYIFIELVTKGSLRNLYQRYTLRDSQVSAYTTQILHGLMYLHDQNVVHRDIKCANILVHASGSVKLADFGLAKATKLNDVKSCKGTAFWMAPEVVKGKNKGYGLPADVWSLGCTVLEMLTGEIPYCNLERMQAIFRIGKGEPPPIPDTLSRDAKDFILQCLQVNPDDRPTAAQLLNHPFLQRPLSQSSAPYIHGRRVLEQLVCRIPGCKFVVVSRFKFPTIFNATYEVELLSEEDALSLFCHHAFGQKSISFTANENLVKQDVVLTIFNGKQVVSECEKLPLVLKVIGAWSFIKRSDINVLGKC
ncbi:hypothetical protein TSUD_216340 [Trifolium subterraneum]|uniref:mitogen-activated protein kinase kinase kinase n=1 Tax=Trifolium subterraneum TaxID=3900 RepID=A0A2Z6MQ41_TRISU|nr:hypothetical protein TSUD_216340 [Trifolium subterraneum]